MRVCVATECDLPRTDAGSSTRATVILKPRGIYPHNGRRASVRYGTV